MREQVGVGVADVRAVGEPEIGELAVADRPPEQVQVAGHVGGVHVGGDSLTVVEALGAEAVEPVEEWPVLVPPVGEDRQVSEEREEIVLAVEAMQGVGGRDAAGIEADDVEATVQLAFEELAEALEDERNPRPTRPAGVDQDAADSVGGDPTPGSSPMRSRSCPGAAGRSRAARWPQRTPRAWEVGAARLPRQHGHGRKPVLLVGVSLVVASCRALGMRTADRLDSLRE